jgi:anti-sigma-K factor RskA
MTATPSFPSVPEPSRQVSPWWRAVAILLLLVLFIGTATGISLFEQFKTQLKHLQSQLVAQPHIQQLAVLLDDQQQPAMLITINSDANSLQIERLNDVQEGREQRLQLWALSTNQAPRSLGILERKIKTPQVPLPSGGLGNSTELAISVEGQDGAAEGRGPNQPWLFRGGLITKAL